MLATNEGTASLKPRLKLFETLEYRFTVHNRKANTNLGL